MTKLHEELKSLVFGNINQQISNSNIDPADKNKLFSRQIWLKFISWFLRVVVLGGLIIYLNNSYNDRILTIQEKNNNLKIDLKRYSFSDSINSKYLNLYIKFEPERRYRFLNHMRFTAPDSELRFQYKALYDEFINLEGELVKSSIISLYQTQVTEIDAKLESKETDFERYRKDPSEESQAKANQAEDEALKLLAQRDTYEQIIEKTSKHFDEEPENKETIIEEVIDEVWTSRFSLKQSFNTEYFIKYIADNKLVVGLKDVESKDSKSALIFLRTGSFQNPSFYQEKRVNLNETVNIKIEKVGSQEVPKNLSNRTINVTLEKVWTSGFRKWAEISCSYEPDPQ